MTAFLAFEWLKFRKRLMPKVILLLLLALTALAFWAQATREFGRDNLFMPRGLLAALTFSAFFAPFFWPVLGGSWAGNEYGWGTLRAVLSRKPQRIAQAVSALAILVVGVGVGLLVILVTGVVAGLVIAGLTGNPLYVSGVLNGDFVGALVKGFFTAWYVSAFYLLLAYAFAVIARSAAVGIGIGIGATLAQVVLRGIFLNLGGVWQTIADHFPWMYTSEMITRVVGGQLIPGTNLASVGDSTPSAGQSVIAIAVYGAILGAVALVAVRTRDITA